MADESQGKQTIPKLKSISKDAASVVELGIIHTFTALRNKPACMATRYSVGYFVRRVAGSILSQG